MGECMKLAHQDKKSRSKSELINIAIYPKVYHRVRSCNTEVRVFKIVLGLKDEKELDGRLG